MNNTYEPHPIALCYPRLSDTDFERLKTDIKANGLLNPIALYEGKILDGTHRYKACVEIGIEACFVTPTILDPYRYVISQNEVRRNLTSGQLGLVASKMATLKHGGHGANQYKKSAEGPMGPSAKNGALTRAEAAKIMGIGETTVQRVQYAETHGIPEVIKAIEDGKISAVRADAISRIPREDQLSALIELDRLPEKQEVKIRPVSFPGQPATPEMSSAERVVKLFKNWVSAVSKEKDVTKKQIHQYVYEYLSI